MTVIPAGARYAETPGTLDIKLLSDSFWWRLHTRPIHADGTPCVHAIPAFSTGDRCPGTPERRAVCDCAVSFRGSPTECHHWAILHQDNHGRGATIALDHAAQVQNIGTDTAPDYQAVCVCTWRSAALHEYAGDAEREAADHLRDAPAGGPVLRRVAGPDHVKDIW